MPKNKQPEKPQGLTIRGEIWWIEKTIRCGDRKTQLRESTGTRDLTEAIRILNARCKLAEAELLEPEAPEVTERLWKEAAAKYVAALKRRGADPDRAIVDIVMLLDTIGDLPLSHVHQETLQGWIDAQEGVRASSTVRRALATCTAILREASRVLRDGNTPWLKQEPPKLRAPDWGARKPYRLTWEEQDRLISFLPEHLVAPVKFALATGARQAEICTLQWSQARTVVGLPQKAVWWIPPEVRKSNAKKSISQQEGRFLICNAMAREVLSGQIGKDDTWVFPSPKGGQLFRINNHGWRTAVAKAGLKIREHDLRHSFGAMLAETGAPFDVRKTLLGHDHNDITSHYSNPGLLMLLTAAEKVCRDVPTLRAMV